MIWKQIYKESKKARVGHKTELDNRNTQEGIKLENAGPWWHTWIRILKIYFHPQYIGSET